MFLGCIDHFTVYNECEFACPKCCYIHFEPMWLPFYKADFEKFEVRCKNAKCHTYLIVIRIENYMLVTEKKIETFLYKTNKVAMLMKTFDVQKHLKRYEGMDINNKLEFIEALQQMVEEDRKRLIDDMKQKLTMLEAGEIPPPPPSLPANEKPKRTRSKKQQDETHSGL